MGHRNETFRPSPPRLGARVDKDSFIRGRARREEAIELEIIFPSIRYLGRGGGYYYYYYHYYYGMVRGLRVCRLKLN